MSSTTTPRPCRTVWFKRDKNDRLRAYYLSRIQFRSFPMPLAEAERMILEGNAVLVERNPLAPPEPPYTHRLGVTTSGWFEVEVFDANGWYVIRRHVESIEEAHKLLALWRNA